MPDSDVEVPVLAALLSLFVMVAAITALVLWIMRWCRQGYVLPYEPRRRPPWGPVAGVLAVMMTAMGIMNVIMFRNAQGEGAQWTAEEFANAQLTMSLIQIGFAAAIVAVLVVVNGASLRDLGLPSSSDQLIYDVTLGIWIAFAAMVPVWVLQLGAIQLLGVPPGHPLLDQMQQTPDWTLFAAAMLTAVVAAPVFEELVFRLLLQGGLERLEDESVGWKFSLPTRREQRVLDDLSAETNFRMAANAPLENEDIEDVPLEPDAAATAARLAAGDELWSASLQPQDLPKLPPGGDGMAPVLNHGWMPVLISSFLFALAHLGNGPSPIPLFALALVLGYVYQRTHRILPCIVAHMVINSVSVLMLILLLSDSGAAE